MKNKFISLGIVGIFCSLALSSCWGNTDLYEPLGEGWYAAKMADITAPDNLDTITIMASSTRYWDWERLAPGPQWYWDMDYWWEVYPEAHLQSAEDLILLCWWSTTRNLDLSYESFAHEKSPELTTQKDEYIDELLYDFKRFSKKDSNFGSTYYAPHCYLAGVDGPVRVYADVSLFGREPGENLSDLMTVSYVHMHSRLICLWPDFTPDEVACVDMPLTEYLREGAMLSRETPSFGMRFKEAPDPVPGKVTFTMEVPIDSDNWYDKPFMRHHTCWKVVEEQRVLKGSVEIDFSSLQPPV